jgi:hypothetical protein
MASNAVIKKPGTLIHIGTIRPFKVTSQPKTSLKRCIKEINANTITAIVVKGFIVHYLFSRLLYYYFFDTNIN